MEQVQRFILAKKYFGVRGTFKPVETGGPRNCNFVLSRAVHGLPNNSAPYLKANDAEPISVRAPANVADRA